MRRFFLAATVIMVTGSPLLADDKAEAVRAEQKRFEGTWRIVSIVIGGTAVPGVNFEDTRLTFEADRFVTKAKETVEGTFVLDPTATPKTIDIKLGNDPTQPIIVRGIYTLEGDTYRLCSAPPGRPRPTEFSSKAGSEQALQVLTRVKR